MPFVNLHVLLLGSLFLNNLLFCLTQGDLEQLTIVPKADLVKQQCSTQVTPIIDPEVTDTIKKIAEKSGKHVVMKIRNKVD